MAIEIIGMCLKCPNNDVEIDQRATGSYIQGVSEWKVTISTKCFCSQANVKLRCAGFKAVQDPNPSIFTKNGDTCSISPSVSLFGPLSFTYARETYFHFDLISSDAQC